MDTMEAGQSVARQCHHKPNIPGHMTEIIIINIYNTKYNNSIRDI